MPGVTAAVIPLSQTSPAIASNDTLSLYWDLASKDVNIRTRAASNLIKQLVQVHAEWTMNASKQGSMEEADAIEAICAPEVSYAIKRLMRGLASSRAGARQGFSVAFTEVRTVISSMWGHESITNGRSDGPRCGAWLTLKNHTPSHSSS